LIESDDRVEAYLAYNDDLFPSWRRRQPRIMNAGATTTRPVLFPCPIADPLTWRAVTAPSLVDFEILANEVYRGLPKIFCTLCADLVIRIEDFATDEILDDMDIDNPFDLLGLFQGVGLPFRAESAPLHVPDPISEGSQDRRRPLRLQPGHAGERHRSECAVLHRAVRPARRLASPAIGQVRGGPSRYRIPHAGLWCEDAMMTKYRRFICKCGNDWMTVLPDIDTCQVCYDDQAHQDIANWIKNIDQSADTTSPGAIEQ
jgi:hypothetical protein